MKFVSLAILVLAAHFNTRAQAMQKEDGSQTATATTKEKIPKSLSLTLSVFNHSISVPFHKILSKPFHPGGQIGIEGRYHETQRSKLFQTLNMGTFYNNYNGTGFYLNTELAYRQTTKYRLFAEAHVGIGYLRTYHPTDIYELNSSGTYTKVKDKGFSSPLFSFAFGLGYAIKSSSGISFAPFILYESLIQTRYSSELDVLPQSAFHIGVRINKKRKG